VAKIPQEVLDQCPPIVGLELSNRGKVRDTYEVPGQDGFILPLATDRISIFDFLLRALVSQKGQVLNAMNIFWRWCVFGEMFAHDLVACGAGIDEYLPESLRGNPELQKRATIVRRLAMLPIEAVVRGYLTGSGWEAYQETGIVCGHRLPLGLQNGSELPCSIFTPTTKATVGHDLHVTADSVAERYGASFERRALQMYELARRFALARGIILVDTKFEGGLDAVGDEVLTPDSSRFWEYTAWLAAQAKGKVPPAYDKQFVREWGLTKGINKRQPEVDQDVEYVHSLDVPKAVLEQTKLIYRYIFWRLTGLKLEAFQRQEMGIDVANPVVNVDVVLGSRSDLDQVSPAIQFLKTAAGQVRVHVISCHRNPEVLRRYVMDLSDVNLIVAAAGKAAALPGVLKAWLNHFENPIPVIGVAMAGDDDSANNAACLSIEQLPGMPVELDAQGSAYFGPAGMMDACNAAFSNEFLPRPIATKPAEFDIV